MKKLYFLAFLLFPLFHLHSQTANISLLENDYNHLLVDVVTPDFSVSEVSCQDTKYALLDMPGYLLATQVGAPSIPVGGTMIEIPVCSQVKVNVLQVEYDTMSLGSDIPLYPAQPSRSKSDTAFHPLVVNEDIYGQDEYWGGVYSGIIYHNCIACCCDNYACCSYCKKKQRRFSEGDFKN